MVAFFTTFQLEWYVKFRKGAFCIENLGQPCSEELLPVLVKVGEGVLVIGTQFYRIKLTLYNSLTLIVFLCLAYTVFNV